MLKDRVRDIDINNISSFSDLLESYYHMGGFMAKNVARAYRLLLEILDNEDYTVFLSFPADIVASGLRGVIKELLRRSLIDIVITTCGLWDHDLARCFKDYYHGDYYMDDTELRRRNIHRLGNILVPHESYGLIIEEKMRAILNDIYRSGIRNLSTYELSWRIGEKLDESSILYWAYKHKIPIIIPGPYDGAVGYQIWQFQQFHRDFKLDIYRDEELLSNIVYDASKTAGIIIGGGISKHHLLWWNQFRGGLDIAIQITTAIELDGSLSGARLSEAITWGKVKAEGREVSIWGEATIILPILVKAVLERLK